MPSLMFQMQSDEEALQTQARRVRAQKQEVRSETADPEMSDVQAGAHSREDGDCVPPGGGLQEVPRPQGVV